MKKFSIIALMIIGLTGFQAKADNCAPGELFNSNTGEKCEVVTSSISGCLPGYVYSYVTGEKCDTVLTNFVSGSVQVITSSSSKNKTEAILTTPKVEIKIDGPTSIKYGGSVNVSWTATNVIACTNPLTLGTNDGPSINQSGNSEPLYSSKYFMIYCTGENSTSTTDGVLVNVEGNNSSVTGLLSGQGLFANALTAAESLNTAPSFELSQMLGVKHGVTLNVRSNFGLHGKIIGKQQAGASGHIIEGPINADGYRWWKIDYITGTDGWSSGEYLELRN